MLAKQTIIFECYCDHCGSGMLQPFMNAGYLKQKSLMAMIGETLTCPACKGENVLESAYQIIPTETLISDLSDLAKLKADDGIKRFMKE